MTRPWLKSFSGQAWSWASLPTRRSSSPGWPRAFLAPVISRVLCSKGPFCWPILFPSLCGAQGGPWAGRQPGRPSSISTFVDPTSDGGSSSCPHRDPSLKKEAWSDLWGPSSLMGEILSVGRGRSHPPEKTAKKRHWGACQQVLESMEGQDLRSEGTETVRVSQGKGLGASAAASHSRSFSEVSGLELGLEDGVG